MKARVRANPKTLVDTSQSHQDPLKQRTRPHINRPSISLKSKTCMCATKYGSALTSVRCPISLSNLVPVLATYRCYVPSARQYFADQGQEVVMHKSDITDAHQMCDALVRASGIAGAYRTQDAVPRKAAPIVRDRAQSPDLIESVGWASCQATPNAQRQAGANLPAQTRSLRQGQGTAER